jgi:3-deoxy-D-manno-octulosonate 8-phosphate phosphatase (KDO 8-P phosphatase)
MIKVLILDVDGVMTDGSIIYDNEGKEYKMFNVRDGFGVRLLKDRKIDVVIISGRTSNVTTIRAKELGIKEVYQGIGDKLALYEQLKLKNGWDDKEIAFIGDDINDVPLMKKVGLSATIQNTFDYVKNNAKIIIPIDGGKGAVRYLIDYIISVNENE